MDQTRDGLLITPQEPPKIDLTKHEKTFINGAKWFYWIAGLSLVNTAIHLARGNVTFVVGLGITQIVDGIAMAVKEGHAEISLIVNVVALIFNGLFAGIFALFGWFACRKHGWAFIVGMVLYMLDGLIFVPFGEWFSFSFHVFAFICIVAGYNALRKLNQAQASAPPIQQPM
ncbi:MAG: hypothetical protein JW749_03935 [Sedimentisphaerales bacterium]|nr:hypothetical protein [Sedimentisphaerales bacterium]